jgi:hypothetical protein
VSAARALAAVAAAWALLPTAVAAQPAMTELGERYVRLVLAVGEHDADYVDAYYGPPEWRAAAAAARLPLARIDDEAAALESALARARPPSGAEEMVRLRHRYLTKQLHALRMRVAMLGGRRLTFDEESAALYDAVAPEHTESEFRSVLAELDRRLPGNGRLVDRHDAFRAQFVIPRDRLAAVFEAAIAGCRERTERHIGLPAEESFTLEYVTGKSWSGYNWYQGGYRSLIQINTDLPIYIDRAIDLACHEGYPGHHVYNVLLEKNLVRDRGWIEYTVYPLFSPQSLIAEGTANYGIEVAFSENERRAFERDVLFPAAGLDSARVGEFYEVAALAKRLSYAGNEAARRYVDGEIDAEAAAAWHEELALNAPERARQRVRFIDQYGAYVINYNLGEDLVAAYIERRAGSDRVLRWRELERLISSPRLPSDLRE